MQTAAARASVSKNKSKKLIKVKRIRIVRLGGEKNDSQVIDCKNVTKNTKKVAEIMKIITSMASDMSNWDVKVDKDGDCTYVFSASKQG
jgi:hypothetical protein